MANLSQEEIQKSKDNAKKAKQLPPSVQYAIVKVMPNIMNGAFWGFESMKGVKEHIEALQADKNIIVRKIADYCILEINPSYMLQAVRVIDANAINQSDMNNIKEAMDKAHLELERFLVRKAKDKAGFGGTVGIYCTNDVTTIKYKGTTYPAFRLGINDVLGFLDNYNYSIQVGGNFVSPREAFGAGQPLWDSMILSPTKTGVFINIRYNGTPEQGKQFDEALKQKYGKK